MSVPSRRRFLAACAAALCGVPVASRTAAAAPRVRPPHPHPTPRPGVTGAKVLTRAQLADAPDAVPLFDAVRAIPEVVDGLRCNCGCPDHSARRSLLSCFEGDGMAKWCPVCQGQGRLAVKLHNEGKSLDEIRAAVDSKFG